MLEHLKLKVTTNLTDYLRMFELIGDLFGSPKKEGILIQKFDMEEYTEDKEIETELELQELLRSTIDFKLDEVELDDFIVKNNTKLFELTLPKKYKTKGKEYDTFKLLRNIQELLNYKYKPHINVTILEVDKPFVPTGLSLAKADFFIEDSLSMEGYLRVLYFDSLLKGHYRTNNMERKNKMKNVKLSVIMKEEMKNKSTLKLKLIKKILSDISIDNVMDKKVYKKTQLFKFINSTITGGSYLNEENDLLKDRTLFLKCTHTIFLLNMYYLTLITNNKDEVFNLEFPKQLELKFESIDDSNEGMLVFNSEIFLNMFKNHLDMVFSDFVDVTISEVEVLADVV